MDLINGLVGLIVLTGPLWLILLFLLIGTWVAFKVRKPFSSGGGKWAASAVVLIVALMLLYGDELAGRAYLNYLCATKAGVELYHTVKLPDEYWSSDGKPKFFNVYGNVDRGLRKQWLDESGGESERYSVLFALDRSAYQVKEKQSKRVLAEVVNFRYWGGWVRRNFGLHNRATSCKFIHSRDFGRSLYGRVFVPIAN